MGNEREWRWRIGVAPPLVGSAGVFAGLRQDLGLGWGLTLVAVTALGAMLALRGVHHRVEAEQARRNVFDAGAGSTAWVMLLMGAAVIPGLALSAIDDAGVRAVVAGLLGTAVWRPSSLSIGYLVVGVMVFAAVFGTAERLSLIHI